MTDKTSGAAEPEDTVAVKAYRLEDLVPLAPLELEDAEASEALAGVEFVDIDGAIFMVPVLTHDAACQAAVSAGGAVDQPPEDPDLIAEMYALQKGQPPVATETFVRHLFGDDRWEAAQKDYPGQPHLFFDVFSAVAAVLSVRAEDELTKLAIKKQRAEAEASARGRMVHSIKRREDKLERQKSRPLARAKMLKTVERNRKRLGKGGKS